MGFTNSYSNVAINQYLISVSLIAISSIGCYFFADLIGYQVVALILLLVVSISAMLFDIYPVLVAALLSALIWNFFFIPPTLTFHISTPENVLMFLMYFVVAMINAVLTYKIRQVEKKNRAEEGKEKTIKLYNTLLNSLSHELRTPIATIIGAIDTIKDADSKLTESNRQELYSEIEIAGIRLNDQVENLLNMSRLEAGNLKPNMDWCDINELVYKIIKDYENEFKDQTILFKPEDDLPLMLTDRGLLEQVIQSILHNALFHTPKNSEVKVSVTYKDSLQITISDNGPGIAKSEQDKIFQKFYRIANSKTGGTGLGLSIAKGYTEALGGSITLSDSDIIGGASFKVQIPVKTMPITALENE